MSEQRIICDRIHAGRSRHGACGRSHDYDRDRRTGLLLRAGSHEIGRMRTPAETEQQRRLKRMQEPNGQGVRSWCSVELRSRGAEVPEVF
jgi:hypothetical protein